MKINLMIRTALAGLIAFGAANAAQRVDVHADYRGKTAKHLEVEASRLRDRVDHPTPAMVLIALPRLAASHNTRDLMQLTEGAITIDQYITNAKARTIAHLDHWIDTDLLVVNGALVVAAVANVAGAVPFVNANRHGGAAFVAAARPADLTRDAFKAALTAHVNAITTAELVAADARVVRPVNGLIETVNDTSTGFKNALEIEIMDWVDNLLNPNAQFLDNAVANQGIHAAIGHGAAVAVGGNPAHAPEGNWRDDFVVKLREIVGQPF